MSQKSLCLSSSGLKNIIVNNQEHAIKFRFLFGQREIKTNKFFAEFISPVISHLHHCDPTIDFFNFEDKFNQNRTTKTTNQIQQYITDHSISQFEQLLQGSSIKITSEDQKSLRIISIILGNNELYQKINEINPQYIDNKPIEELIDELIIYNELSINGFEYSDIIDRLSRDFSQIDKKRVKSIPKEVVYSIFRNEHFERKNEDELFDLISMMQINNEDEKTDFYEEIDFKKLSSTKFRDFIENFDYNEMTEKIWSKLCECFYINHNGTTIKNAETNEKIEFDGNSQNRLKGIIHKLTQKAGGNVSEKGIVDVTSSSIFNSCYYPKNAVDFDNCDNCYGSEDNTYDQWLRYDFKERKIRPTRYSIRTRNDADNCNPQNWCIEVSNTGYNNDWRIIDSRKNVTSLRKSSQIDTFEINSKLQPNESYRYIRMRQTGKSSENKNHLAISALEFFGELIEN